VPNYLTTQKGYKIRFLTAADAVLTAVMLDPHAPSRNHHHNDRHTNELFCREFL